LDKNYGIRTERLAGVRKSEFRRKWRLSNMTALEIVIGIVLLLAALFLIVVIMLQDKAKRGLSGAIAGGSSSSYLGKNGAPQKGKLLPMLTTIVAIVFVVIVVVAYLLA
jgi:preprotein translocase subunit SecG